MQQPVAGGEQLWHVGVSKVAVERECLKRNFCQDCSDSVYMEYLLTV
jgi:hypothetical protein